MRTRPPSPTVVAVPLVFFLALVGAWQLADSQFKWQRILFPNPVEVVEALRSNSTQLAINGLITLAEAVLGFLLGGFVGFAIAAIVVLWPPSSRVIVPYAVVIKAVPIVVLAPLLVMWLGDGLLSKVVMAAIAAFFPILVNGVRALTSVDQEWCDLMHLHGATKWQTFRMLRVPYALPELFAGLKVATSLAMVGAVVAEFTGSSRGIGHLITTSTYYLNTDLVFAGVIVLGALGLAFYGALVLLERVVVFWKRVS